MRKITVKAEKEVLRKAIPYGDETIIINELSERQKIELINKIQRDLAINKKIDERKFMLDIIEKCTNIVFDKDVFEVEEPTYEATIIIGEITLMFLELVEEQKIYTDIQLKVNGNIKEVDTENKQERVNAHEKIEEIEDKVEEEKVEEEVEEEVIEEVIEEEVIEEEVIEEEVIEEEKVEEEIKHKGRKRYRRNI